jgi:hypothetical protein
VPLGHAQFFESLGFSVDIADLLIAALRLVARTGDVVESVETAHGEKLLSTACCRRVKQTPRPRLGAVLISARSDRCDHGWPL